MILTPSNSLLGSAQYQYQTQNQEQTQTQYQTDTSNHSYYQQYSYPGYYNTSESFYYSNPNNLLIPNQFYALSSSASSLSSNNSYQQTEAFYASQSKKRSTEDDSEISPISSSVSSPNSDSNNKKAKGRQSRISGHKKQKLEKLEDECGGDEEEDEEDDLNETLVDGVQEPKKRVTANKKERRRTQSINNAFEDLRKRIPEIPFDTKLSKIKTLKLAIGYIEHLMRLLQENDPSSLGPFKPDLGKLRRECRSKEIKIEVERKSKGRTGWPAEVWSSEMKKKMNETPSVSNNNKKSNNFNNNQGYVSHDMAMYSTSNQNI